MSMEFVKQAIRENPEVTIVVAREISQTVWSGLLRFLPLTEHFRSASNKRLIAQRMARMVVGGALTAAALSAFYKESELSRRIWSAKIPWVTWWLRAITGHFIGDSLEILRARFFTGCPPQNDMIAHHVVGWLVYVMGLKVYGALGPVGAFYGVGAMAGEILTLFSGPMFLLTAMTEQISPSMFVAALLKIFHWARVSTIILFRIPMWSWLLYRALTESSQPDGIRDPQWSFAATCWMTFACTYILGMDFYWIRMLLRFKSKNKKLV